MFCYPQRKSPACECLRWKFTSLYFTFPTSSTHPHSHSIPSSFLLILLASLFVLPAPFFTLFYIFGQFTPVWLCLWRSWWTHILWVVPPNRLVVVSSHRLLQRVGPELCVLSIFSCCTFWTTLAVHVWFTSLCWSLPLVSMWSSWFSLQVSRLCLQRRWQFLYKNKKRLEVFVGPVWFWFWNSKSNLSYLNCPWVFFQSYFMLIQVLHMPKILLFANVVIKRLWESPEAQYYVVDQ